MYYSAQLRSFELWLWFEQLRVSTIAAATKLKIEVGFLYIVKADLKYYFT
jgi:hypothetical protein